MTRPLCIYHKNCLDGSASAAVVKRREPDCEFLAMQYSQKPPQVLDRKVYIVDFGLPIERMRAIKAQASEVVWIDHHASHLPIRAALGWGTLDTAECGASLTWKCLFPDRPAPPVIAYIKDKDLWTWQLPDSRAIAAGLQTRFKGDQFEGLLDVDLAEMARIGRPELESLAARVSVAVKNGVAVQDPYALPGVRALAVNCNQDQNDVGDHICLPVSAGGLGYDLAILYYRKGGGRWVHSLRSGTTVDCAAIAEARGGGGHRSSACYLADDPFIPAIEKPAMKNDAPRR
jgi:uncharacterized protein